MAEFNIEFPDDFLSDLLNTDFDDIAESALIEAAPILESSLKTSIKRVISHDGESEAANSIKARKPRKTKTDAWVVNVGPSGNSKDKKYYAKDGRGVHTHRNYPVSNALKLIWKEYGIAGRQPATPFLTNACNNATSQIMDKIQKVYEEKVGMK